MTDKTPKTPARPGPARQAQQIGLGNVRYCRLEAWEAPTPRPSGKVAQARKDSKG
jgi:hypothetical protein